MTRKLITGGSYIAVLILFSGSFIIYLSRELFQALSLRTFTTSRPRLIFIFSTTRTYFARLILVDLDPSLSHITQVSTAFRIKPFGIKPFRIKPFRLKDISSKFYGLPALYTLKFICQY